MNSAENKPPILHILVIGFHHKLGCQVEFSYPSLIPGTSGRNECPSGWKYLPTLALPDGSHNFQTDTVFFNLPSLMEPAESIYGVSCYRQIPVEELKIRTADVTRSTVQKSVCILSRLPIYGYIEVKLSLIANAFFEQGDFSSTELLIDAYHQLNACLLDDESRRPLRHFYVGLSIRDIILNWRHKTLILFKLFLLQRRTVCFGSPVRGMCVLILGIASLIPRLLEKGFQEVACVRTSRPLSPMPDFTGTIERETAALKEEDELQQQQQQEHQLQEKDMKEENTEILKYCEDEVVDNISSSLNLIVDENFSEENSPESASNSSKQSLRDLNRMDSTESNAYIGSMNDVSKRSHINNSLTREASVDTLNSNLFTLISVNPDEYRSPISIFASGNLCLPYISLPYMDLLTDPSVLSYVIGTSNVLFQQKRQLADVLIDIENCNIDTHDQHLRRQLQLSTEDLRFMDYILKHVQSPKEDGEGSEYWIREQFQGYILSMLRTSVANDVTSKDTDHFNSHFMHAFKRTQCFQEWYDVRPESEFFDKLPTGHPFAGTLSVADMKLKISQTMQNSESGRKINQAVTTTKVAVGDAISQAKGAFSNWWSSITTAPTIQATTNNGNSIMNLDNETATTTATTTTTSQIQEISVTFQNNRNIDDIEVGVSINMSDDLKLKHKRNDFGGNGDNDGFIGDSSISSTGSEKQIDSAEELQEGDIEEIKNQNSNPTTKEELNNAQKKQTITNILDGKCNNKRDLNEIKACVTPQKQQPIQQQQQQGVGGIGGIIEIGREAELLDNLTLKNPINMVTENTGRVSPTITTTSTTSKPATTAAAATATTTTTCATDITNAEHPKSKIFIV